MATKLSVSLRGMRFHTLVGILPHEREFAQPLEVDVIAQVAVQAGIASVDYRQLYELTAAAAARGTGYLETLADELANAILALPGISQVEIALRKPHVPLPGPLDHAEIRLVRTSEPAGAIQDPVDADANTAGAGHG